MKLFVAMVCLFAVAVANPLDRYILNGEKATLGQFPWMAYIFGCSASVVNARSIVTAAHCVCSRTPTTVEVGMVEHGKGTSYPVVATHLFPGYPTGSGCAVVRDHDLAVLKTGSDIAFNTNVQPIELFISSPEPSPGATIISMGFGGDHNEDYDVLNFARTTLTSSGCGAAYFCSSRSPNSIYPGDSGGPMVIEVNGKPFQLGVNSGITRSTSLYANIPRYYTTFIQKHL